MLRATRYYYLDAPTAASAAAHGGENMPILIRSDRLRGRIVIASRISSIVHPAHRSQSGSKSDAQNVLV
ncbi:MAG: hypothetical protein ACR2M3_13160 [Thermomicrobiales bacterium]